jgi:hypothetical protein
MAMTKIQEETLKLWRSHKECYAEVARITGKGESTVRKSVKGALAWLEASEGHRDALEATGLDIGQAHHGWRIIVDPVTGSKDSVFWKKETDDEEDPVNLVEVLKTSLRTIPPIGSIKSSTKYPSKDLCNFIPLADLHVGGEYGDPGYLDAVYEALDRLMGDLPKATKAVLMDMGDLLDANDHKGLTPASGNDCDVIRENHLKNTVDGVNIMSHAIVRLTETHEEVEVHLLRGNHDETAYIGVMVALHYRFKDNPQVKIILSDDNFRVISWGLCAVFPHHGDKAKWEDLKSVFSDQFPDLWAKAKYWRFIWTAHVHHDKQRQLIGADAEHFRTLAAPNNWAQMKGLFSRGGIQCITLHKKWGETHRNKANLIPLLLQDDKRREIKL